MRRLLGKADYFELTPYIRQLNELVSAKERYLSQVDKKGQRYLCAQAALPEVTPSSCDFASDWVRIGEPGDLSDEQNLQLQQVLEGLCPWRKGPFELFGTRIDSEWISSLKWARVSEHLEPLDGKRILDIGSSNGYYLFRMLQQQPKLALGVEPYLTFYFQYRLLQHYARQPNLHCLPVKFEELPVMHSFFDTVFSMGVLYHRRSPLDTIVAMRQVLKKGGQLILETLVIEGEGDLALCPDRRYAKMNNVYFLPTVQCLSHWLQRSGFEGVRCVDVTPTTRAEQRKTDWIQTESLADFLDPSDPTRTVEGYPAPVRAILVARAK